MDNKKLKVLFTTNMPAPYAVDYLDLLGRQCQLTAVFEKGAVKDRLDQWYGNLQDRSFQSIILKKSYNSKEPFWQLRILKHINRSYDRIIIGNPLTVAGIIALLYCRLFRVPFILQSEGGFRGKGEGLKEKIKKFLMEKATLYLSGMQGESEYFLSYGATAEKLRHYPFTSLHEGQIYAAPATAEEKQQLRKELGIEETTVVISVGRPIPVKGFDVLLQAKKALPAETGMYFVGGEATEEYRAIIEAESLKHVHFILHCDYETLQKYYRAADVFVLPTRGDTWGLVINEAMACGLPVITTDRCVAGLQLIENNSNGYIIPVDDTAALSQGLNKLLADPALCAEMSANNLEKIRPYTIENMARTIYNALQ